MQLHEIKTVISDHRYFENIRGLLWAPPLDECYIISFYFWKCLIFLFALLRADKGELSSWSGLSVQSVALDSNPGHRKGEMG